VQNQYDKQRDINDTLISAQSALREQNEQLSNEIQALRQGLRVESAMRDNLENHDRKMNLDFSGLPIKDKEEPVKLIAKVMRLAGSTFSAADVDVAHRKRAGGMIVRFKTRQARDEVFSKRFNLKNITSLDLGFSEKHFIYVNKSLTFDRSVLMKQVRDQLRTFNRDKAQDQRAKVKTEGGVIKLKLHDGGYRKVNSLNDLTSIL